MDYVCFIPPAENENTQKMTCIAIEDKLYCYADISNIEYCKLKGENYYFRQCVKEAAELFTDFEYIFISGPTIMPPPPFTRTTVTPEPTIIKPTRTIITLDPTIIKPTKTFITLDPTIIKPTKTIITLDPTIIKPTKTKITLDPTIIKPTTIIRPTRTIIIPTIISVTDSFELPIKTGIIADPIPTIKPYRPTTIPVPIVRPTYVPEVKKDETE